MNLESARNRRAPRAAIAGFLLAAAALLAPMAGAVDLSAPIGNVAPTLTSVTLGGLTSGSLSPVAGTTSSLTVTVVAADANGYTDITGVTVGILKPDGSTVHVAQAAASFSSGSLLAATYTKTLTMNYYDAAALTTSTYKVKVIATDSGGLTVNNLAGLSTFNFAQLVAVNAPATLDLGGTAINPGSAGSVRTLSLDNYGNVQLDAQISGTALTSSGNTIAVGSVAYSLNSDMSSSAALSGSATTLASFDLGSGSSSAKNLYFQLTVPTGVPSGTYAGTLTVTAVSG